MVEKYNINDHKGTLVINFHTLKELNAGQLKCLYSNFFPIFMKLESFGDVIYIDGYCKKFRKIKEGQIFPTYEITLHELASGSYRFSCKEIKY